MHKSNLDARRFCWKLENYKFDGMDGWLDSSDKISDRFRVWSKLKPKYEKSSA